MHVSRCQKQTIFIPVWSTFFCWPLSIIIGKFDPYSGTTERVCLISGSVDGIMRINEFIMEKIKEKPDPNAKMAIDFDNKQPAEREKQVLFATRGYQ